MDDDKKAFELGRQWAKDHTLASLGPQSDSEVLWQAARKAGCPLRFFDVFKYGCHDVWRERGEM